MNRTLALVLLLVGLFGGCSGNQTSSSGTGGGTPQPQGASNVVAGPWTGMAVSSGANGTSVFIANLTDQGSGSFFAANTDAQICTQFHPQCIESLPIESSGICCRYSVQGTVDAKSIVTTTITVLDGNNSPIGTIAVTGTLSMDGKSISGKYSSTYTNGMAPDAGNFTANLVKPITGNYSGSLTSASTAQSFPVSASLTEASDGTISGTAVISNSACASTITWTAIGTDHSFAIGGGFHLWSLGSTGSVSADVIPNGDGTYSVSYGINTTTCSDSGTGTIK